MVKKMATLLIVGALVLFLVGIATPAFGQDLSSKSLGKAANAGANVNVAANEGLAKGTPNEGLAKGANEAANEGLAKGVGKE